MLEHARQRLRALVDKVARHAPSKSSQKLRQTLRWQRSAAHARDRRPEPLSHLPQPLVALSHLSMRPSKTDVRPQALQPAQKQSQGQEVAHVGTQPAKNKA